MTYFHLVWATPTLLKVQSSDNLVVLQDSAHSIEFVNSVLTYSKDAGVRRNVGYAGLYRTAEEAEAAAVAKLAMAALYQEVANSFKLELELRKPAKQIISETRTWASKLPNLQQTPKGSAKLPEGVLQREAKGVYSLQELKLEAYLYEGSEVELPSLSFPDELDDSQKAKCIELFRKVTPSTTKD